MPSSYLYHEYCGLILHCGRYTVDLKTVQRRAPGEQGMVAVEETPKYIVTFQAGKIIDLEI